MWDTIQKLEYREKANIAEAKLELQERLSDRVELPLPGIHGEKLFLTGANKLRKRSAELNTLYEKQSLPWGVKDVILLDAYSSATIEGARTTVAKVRKSFDNPNRTKDDVMVINTIAASDYAYKYPITAKNIRRLWEKVVDGVCENGHQKGTLYRDGMVFIGNSGNIVHTPAAPEQLPELMDRWFAYRESETEDVLTASFVAHFYFVYVHPFCDGNGRTARIANASYLYHNGYRKMKRLPLSSAINAQIGGYYGSLSDSEICLSGPDGRWLDVSPFVSFMQDAFERCLIDASLSRNTLSEPESTLLERMNKVGIGAEITSAKAAKVLKRSDSAARSVLKDLVQKGYLTEDTSHVPHIFRLQKHIPD